MKQKITFARYGLLMAGQSLGNNILAKAKYTQGYFCGTLLECRQTHPLPIGNGIYHYPLALLTPAKAKIKCEICSQEIENANQFWQDMFETEMVYPDKSPESSLMQLAYTNVFLKDDRVLYIPVFVFNPLFYIFWGQKYKMALFETNANAEGYVSWSEIAPWSPH